MMNEYYPRQAKNYACGSISDPLVVSNWSQILFIIDLMETQPSITPEFVGSIIFHFQKSNFPQKLNLLHLIDALFKNSKKNNLIYFQTNQLTDIFNLLEISKNPELRNYIVKNSPFSVSTFIVDK
jgi:hypothetical protein